jgi:hypothetical protein
MNNQRVASTLDDQGLVDFALSNGAKDSPERRPVLVFLNAAQEFRLQLLVNILGASAEALLDMAVRYAVCESKMRQVKVTDLPDYPKRLRGKEVAFTMTRATQDLVIREKLSRIKVARAAVCGLRLLYQRLLCWEGT